MSYIIRAIERSPGSNTQLRQERTRMNVIKSLPVKESSGHLSGRIAVVTGSTSGIGLGIARALAADGAAK
jgi:hypothetical protein